MSVDSTKPHFIPDRWKPSVAEHVLRTRGKEEERLSAYDFRPDSYVRLRFEDNSEATYQYAFCLYFYSEEAVTVEQMQVIRDS